MPVPKNPAAIAQACTCTPTAMAKKSGRANDEYLRLYALEGFLLRLAASASSQDLILKGGVLLAAYQLRRPTADIDFAALKTPNDVETIKSMIITVSDTQLPDDQKPGPRGSTARSGVDALVLAPSAAPASVSRTGVAPPRPTPPIR